LRLFSFGGYGLALAALALVVFGAIECLALFLPLLFHSRSTKIMKTAIALILAYTFLRLPLES